MGAIININIHLPDDTTTHMRFHRKTNTLIMTVINIMSRQLITADQLMITLPLIKNSNAKNHNIYYRFLPLLR